MKYIHSDAVLFLNKENKFHAANFAILDVKFTSRLAQLWKNDGK